MLVGSVPYDPAASESQLISLFGLRMARDPADYSNEARAGVCIVRFQFKMSHHYTFGQGNATTPKTPFARDTYGKIFDRLLSKCY